ncbi:uncharacterized protein LOC106011627 [Aplysia californica]|uniref:Uncharacterized protein LOC106011627 n=1 Tax=Aplysia californica TaxID=6500 RepID=A0ABM0ZYU8_APLCA|nr:uncharacterized protein LOC106011627 [Aplysia californica]
MPRLTNEERNQAVGMLRANTPDANVARTFNVTRDTIYRLMTRLQTSGSVQDGPRTGRPRATTPALDQYIRVLHLRDRFRPATKTAREWKGRRLCADAIDLSRSPWNSYVQHLQTWNNIPQLPIQRLLQSMRQSCTEVANA